MNIFRLLLNLALTILIVFLGYQLYLTIDEPIQFNKEKEIRDTAVIKKLKDLRNMQLAYRENRDTFANSFDTLIHFIKTEEFTVIKKIGDPNDSTVVAKIEEFKVGVLDSLFKENRSSVDDIALIPNGNGEKFSIASGMVTKNEVEFPAFEISAPYKVIYNGMVKKYYQDKRNDFMTVGSLTDGTTSGNWEK